MTCKFLGDEKKSQQVAKSAFTNCVLLSWYIRIVFYSKQLYINFVLEKEEFNTVHLL
jgi:hypothetical protein